MKIAPWFLIAVLGLSFAGNARADYLTIPEKQIYSAAAAGLAGGAVGAAAGAIVAARKGGNVAQMAGEGFEIGGAIGGAVGLTASTGKIIYDIYQDAYSESELNQDEAE